MSCVGVEDVAGGTYVWAAEFAATVTQIKNINWIIGFFLYESFKSGLTLDTFEPMWTEGIREDQHLVYELYVWHHPYVPIYSFYMCFTL